MNDCVAESTAPSVARSAVATNRSLRRLLVWFTFTVATAVLLFLGILQGHNTDWKVARPSMIMMNVSWSKSSGAVRMVPRRSGPSPTNHRQAQHAQWEPKPRSHKMLFRDHYLDQMARLKRTLKSLDFTSGNLTNVQITRSIRNHTVHAVCQAEQLNSVWKLDSISRKMLMRQIIVDDERKFLYCYVPKVACSNWKRVIKFMQGTIDDIAAHFKMDHKNGLVFLDNFSNKEINFRLKHYYKFMFVRNPVERLLSAFRNKFREDSVKDFKLRFAARIIRKYRKGGWDGKSDSVTLKEFMMFLLDSNPATMDLHWKPMHLLCHPCAVHYDFIGSFEQLHEDANYLLERLKGDTGAYFPPRQDWYNPTTNDKVDALLSEIDPVYIQQYVDKYILDFITFGYAPPKQYYIKHSQVNDSKTSENEVDQRGSENS